jgi:hypothetical protein
VLWTPQFWSADAITLLSSSRYKTASLRDATETLSQITLVLPTAKSRKIRQNKIKKQ